MPNPTGGAQNLRRGDKVRIKLDSSYRYYLNGLTGVVTSVLHHGVIVAIDGGDPAQLQRVVGQGGQTGPTVPAPVQREFQFHEVERIE